MRPSTSGKKLTRKKINEILDEKEKAKLPRQVFLVPREVLEEKNNNEYNKKLKNDNGNGKIR